MLSKEALFTRWMILLDIPEVLEIDNQSFVKAMGEEYLLSAMRQRNCIGKVAEHEGKVIGFMLYELNKRNLHLLRFAVHSAWRRAGVGSVMIEDLIRRLACHRRNCITIDVPESLLSAQMFFQKNSFDAITIIRGDDGAESAYRMAHRLIRPSRVSTEPLIDPENIDTEESSGGVEIAALEHIGRVLNSLPEQVRHRVIARLVSDFRANSKCERALESRRE